MALRDAVKPPEGAKAFAKGLFNYIYGTEELQLRFEKFSEVLISLPRRQTRVSTWPLQTIFGFLANPDEHIFLNPGLPRLLPVNTTTILFINHVPIGKRTRAYWVLLNKFERM
jgi:hypothetical protein